MSKEVRTTSSLVVSLMLFSAMAVAHAGGNNANKHMTKNKEHHNPFAKLEFWHHHKDGHSNAKRTQAKHAQAKQAQAKAAHTKPAPQTVAAGKKDQKQEQHALGKTPAKKVSAATKTKPQDKTQNPTMALIGP